MSNPSMQVNVQVASGGSAYNSSATISDVTRKYAQVNLSPGADGVHLSMALKCTGGSNDVDSLILSAVGGDVTIYTNTDGGSSNPAVVMTAGQTIIYVPGGTNPIGSNPFPTADVTDMYLDSTAGATFTVDAIVKTANG